MQYYGHIFEKYKGNKRFPGRIWILKIDTGGSL